MISPDCDTYGDRVIVVVRGNEQLAGVRLEVRKGDRLVRTVRVGRRARALAVSWPPYDGKRCTTAPDGRYRLRVIARDVPGNTRAVDLGQSLRGASSSRRPTARSSRASAPGSASPPTRAACASSSRGWRRGAAILARATRAPAATARVPAASRGGVYVVSNRHAGRTPRRCSRSAGRARAVALLVAGSPRPSSCPSSDGWMHSGSASTPSRAGACAAGARRVRSRRRPRGRRKRGRALGHSARDERDGIKPGLGS